MKTSITKLLMVVCSGMIMMSGCAKEQLKKDEGVATPPAVQQPAETPQTGKSAPVKEQAVTTPIIKESPVASEETTTTTVSAKDRELVEKLINTIYFDFDSSVLLDKSRDTLSKNADVLIKKLPKVKIQIEGHCDERGSAEYNLALGERRAKSALNYLVTLGVPAERLSIISYGKEKPVDPGHDETAWAKNRRAEFVVAP
jgi:peptidoglycan-associated lipoprotein